MVSECYHLFKDGRKCPNEAKQRCHTCNKVFCVEHYTQWGGSEYAPVTYECDNCRDRRLHKEAKLRSESRTRYLLFPIIGLVLGAIIASALGARDAGVQCAGGFFGAAFFFFVAMEMDRQSR